MFVAFTGASGLFNNAFNKLACLATGNARGYCHVECGCDTDLGHLRELAKRLQGKGGEVARRTSTTLNDLLDAYPLSAPNTEKVCLAFHAFYGQPLGVRILSPHCPDPLYQPYDDNWTVYRLPGASDATVKAQTAWALSKVGLPYDSWGALLSPVRSFHKEPSAVEPDPETWWCSAHALRFVQNVGFLTETYSLKGCTPNNLGSEFHAHCLAYKAPQPSTPNAQSVHFVHFDEDHWSAVGNVVHHVVPAVLRGSLRRKQRVLTAGGSKRGHKSD